MDVSLLGMGEREMIFVCFLGRTTLVIDIAAMLDLIQWEIVFVVWWKVVLFWLCFER